MAHLKHQQMKSTERNRSRRSQNQGEPSMPVASGEQLPPSLVAKFTAELPPVPFLHHKVSCQNAPSRLEVLIHGAGDEHVAVTCTSRL